VYGKESKMSGIIENRKNERIVIDGNTTIFFKVEQDRFKVIDLSCTGVRIKTDSATQFSLTQILPLCELEFEDGFVKPLTGQVIHFIAQPGDGAHFGIQLLNLDAAATDMINSRLEKMKVV
jgi:hypothetical protein